MPETLTNPNIRLPDGAQLVLDDDGNLIGARIGGVTIDAEDFTQNTVDALIASFENPPQSQKVAGNIIFTDKNST